MFSGWCNNKLEGTCGCGNGKRVSFSFNRNRCQNKHSKCVARRHRRPNYSLPYRSCMHLDCKIRKT